MFGIENAVFINLSIIWFAIVIVTALVIDMADYNEWQVTIGCIILAITFVYILFSAWHDMQFADVSDIVEFARCL